ncbi:MAG: hypothetical protein OXF08_06130 [Bacteroidetes bacterium]|nr:hypothetical protein [Bacteroidota bacterium]
MNKKIIIPCILCFFSVWTIHAQKLDQVTPDKVIQKLTSPDFRVAFEGLEDYMRLPEDQHTPAIKSALVQALINENRRIQSIRIEKGEDFPLYKLEGQGEALLFLMGEVYDLRDPATIPALLPWCQTGDEMVDFGRVAFDPILSYVEEPPEGTSRYSIGSCIYTLRMMVDYWGLSSFSSSEHQRMRQVAEKYIVNSKFYTMYDAITLAASLNDRSLLQMADNLINNDEEMAKRQVTNIDMLKKIVSRALSGTLVERQYVPYEERQKRGY